MSAIPNDFYKALTDLFNAVYNDKELYNVQHELYEKGLYPVTVESITARITDDRLRRSLNYAYHALHNYHPE